jgi:hypothetical protein
MKLNLTSLKYKEKASLDSGDIDWRKIVKKMNNVNSTTNTCSNSPHATWPMTPFVKLLYVLVAKQLSALNANAKAGTKQVSPSSSALSPFPNLEMQHDGRSARIWMKKVNYFCIVVGGRKGFAREHQNGFYKT